MNVFWHGEEYLKKNKNLQKLIRIIRSPNRNLAEKLNFYKECFESYIEWRNNFKFPKTIYLARINQVKPLPPPKLIKNLAIALSELREDYLKLANYRLVIIFKLFLFYFAETFKASNRIKINKSIGGPFSRWASGGKTPTRRDIDTLMDIIVLHIFKFEHSDSDKKMNEKKDGWIFINYKQVKIPNFKWNLTWKKLRKNILSDFQDSFATREYGDSSENENSLIKKQKMIKKYENLINKKKHNSKDTFNIVNLFYDLSYFKDFSQIRDIFKDQPKIQKNQHSLNDWQPLKSEIGKDGKAIPWFEDNGGLYKERVFPQFTIKNIKRRFNKKVFLETLKSEKSIKTSLAMALNGDPELEYAFEYDELLPDHDIITIIYIGIFI